MLDFQLRVILLTFEKKTINYKNNVWPKSVIVFVSDAFYYYLCIHDGFILMFLDNAN